MELFNADIINVDAEEAWAAHVANMESDMTDREKFDAWIKACPVSILKQDNYQNGYVEVHVSLPDEVE